MAELGKTLSQARVARGLTLEDCERDTRISKRYLGALEREDWRIFPVPVYSRAFLRTYAQYLSLDAHQIMRAMQDAVEPAEMKPLPEVRTAPASGTAVILFTDIVDSTALTERLGDARFREASRAIDERLRAAIREGGGTPIEGKVLGDGVMASFASAREAIAVALRCSELSGESELALHIGLHAGDVIHEPDPGGQSNVYGGTVNIASRICGLAAPGEVLVSDVVRGMARSSADVTFIDRGEREMKGVGEPVRVYAVVAGDRG